MHEFSLGAVKVEEDQNWIKELGLPGLATYIGSESALGAMQEVPIDTGALRDSLRYDMTEKDLRSPVVQVSANTFYALFVELGTALTSAQPYLWPGVVRGVKAALSKWKPGESYADKSARTVTAKEAGMDRSQRESAVKAQAQRDEDLARKKITEMLKSRST